MVKVIIVDDQRLLRESIKRVFENSSDIEVLACASNGQEAFELCSSFNPDVILMDILMPVCDGIEATRLIKSKYPETRILMLTTSNEKANISRAINFGADGYVLKDVSPEELILAVKSLYAGLDIVHKEVYKTITLTLNSCTQSGALKKVVTVGNEEVNLSERELEIIKMIAEGINNKEIASKFYITEGRLKNIITGIISKMKLKDRTQLAVFAIKNNLI